jgi:hypothetical protein
VRDEYRRCAPSRHEYERSVQQGTRGNRLYRSRPSRPDRGEDRWNSRRMALISRSFRVARLAASIRRVQLRRSVRSGRRGWTQIFLTARRARLSSIWLRTSPCGQLPKAQPLRFPTNRRKGTRMCASAGPGYEAQFVRPSLPFHTSDTAGVLSRTHEWG